MNERRLNNWPQWPDARGWTALALFLLTIMLLWMIKEDAELRKDEFFKTIAVLIIGTGFINGVCSFFFSATKQGGDLAASNARIAEEAATAAVKSNAEPTREPPADAKQAADQVAEAAADEAEQIGGTRG